jgi:hypothetical protein
MVGFGGRSSANRCHDCKKKRLKVNASRNCYVSRHQTDSRFLKHKCDGGKPHCFRCMEDGLTCSGYKRVLEFVFFDGGSYARASDTAIEESSQQVKSRNNQPSGKESVSTIELNVVKKRRITDSRHIDQVTCPTEEQPLRASQQKSGFLSILLNCYLPDYGVVFSCEGRGVCPS